MTSLIALFPAGAQTRATWIGAYGGNNLADWNAMNAAIGPAQTAREFYPNALPASWSDTYCSGLDPSVVCTISYNTMDTNVTSFVESIPSNRTAPVFMTFHHEAEGDFSSGAVFVSDFESQVDEIRSACATAGNCGVVKVATIAAASYYQAANPDCTYIPPAGYVDDYFVDAYQPVLVGLKNDAGFQGWKICTNGLGVDRGLTEYGLGTCVSSGTWTEQAREQELAADAKYLSNSFPDLVMWEDWYVDDSSVGACKDWQFPAGSVTATEWKAIEAGTVSS